MIFQNTIFTIKKMLPFTNNMSLFCFYHKYEEFLNPPLIGLCVCLVFGLLANVHFTRFFRRFWKYSFFRNFFRVVLGIFLIPAVALLFDKLNIVGIIDNPVEVITSAGKAVWFWQEGLITATVLIAIQVWKQSDNFIKEDLVELSAKNATFKVSNFVMRWTINLNDSLNSLIGHKQRHIDSELRNLNNNKESRKCTHCANSLQPDREVENTLAVAHQALTEICLNSINQSARNSLELIIHYLVPEKDRLVELVSYNGHTFYTDKKSFSTNFQYSQHFRYDSDSKTISVMATFNNTKKFHVFPDTQKAHEDTLNPFFFLDESQKTNLKSFLVLTLRATQGNASPCAVLCCEANKVNAFSDESPCQWMYVHLLTKITLQIGLEDAYNRLFNYMIKNKHAKKEENNG
ncbi:MAG: hypothetical protein PF904_12270 [Kiritimatiellae bacterium]|jgi:hypothetical protein|nr:hypothetical protein [Kiritimatiellia bacterium]